VATRRFYWELVAYRRSPGALLPIDVLATADLQSALAEVAGMLDGCERRVAPVIEVTGEPAQADRLIDAIARAAEALEPSGFALDLWPHLPDDEARFLNTTTAGAYRRALAPLIDRLIRLGERLPKRLGWALDVEANQGFLTAGWKLGDRSLASREKLAAIGTLMAGVASHARAASRGVRELVALRSDIAATGLPIHTAVLPRAFGLLRSPRVRTYVLGCPDEDTRGAPLWELAAPMCYVPLLRRAWGKRDREAERRVLRSWARRHLAPVSAGRANAIVLGQLSQGIMRDEPVYESPDELAEDVAIVRELGYSDIGFFSLEGLLYGPPGVPAAGSFAPTRQEFSGWVRAMR
jgi:hypothetical protein